MCTVMTGIFVPHFLIFLAVKVQKCGQRVLKRGAQIFPSLLLGDRRQPGRRQRIVE